jgi:phage tail sheath protein FI
MSLIQAPGVAVNEVIVPPAYAVDNQDVTSFTAAFVGWHNQGPLVPTLIQSYSQFTQVYGGFSSTAAPSDLAIGVYMYFANGGNQCYVLRVLGTSAVPAANVLVDTTPAPTIDVIAANPGAWGNSVSVIVTLNAGNTAAPFNIFIAQGGVTQSNIKERWNNLSMVQGASNYFATVINNALSGSSYITVTDVQGTPTVTGNPPNAQTLTLGAGNNSTVGVDGSVATTTQLSATPIQFDSIDRPLVINVPNCTTASVITAFNTYVTTTRAFQDSIVVADTPKTAVPTPPSGIITYVETLPTSSYLAVFGPCLIINDPTSTIPGSTRTVPAGAAVCGVMASIDASYGVAQPTAGTLATISALSLEQVLTTANIGALNAAQINTIRFLQGSGIVIWGSNTLSNLAINQFLSVRRTLIYIESNLRSLTQFAPFQNNNATLWSTTTSRITQWLNSFWAQGGLAGATAAAAFVVTCDASNNNSSSDMVNVTASVAVQDPAVFINISVSQGFVGTTVSEASAVTA